MVLTTAASEALPYGGPQALFASDGEKPRIIQNLIFTVRGGYVMY